MIWDRDIIKYNQRVNRIILKLDEVHSISTSTSVTKEQKPFYETGCHNQKTKKKIFE